MHESEVQHKLKTSILKVIKTKEKYYLERNSHQYKSCTTMSVQWKAVRSLLMKR